MPAAETNDVEVVTVYLDDGTEVECGIVTIFPVPHLNSRFIALNPINDNNFGSTDEIHLYALISANNENLYELAEIDEDDFDMVLTEFNRIIED